MSTYKLRSGVKSFLRISNWVGPIFVTLSPQKLTRFLGSPLSTTRRNSRIDPDQLAPGVRMYSMRCSEKGRESLGAPRRTRSKVLSRSRSMQYLFLCSAVSAPVPTDVPTLGL